MSDPPAPEKHLHNVCGGTLFTFLQQMSDGGGGFEPVTETKHGFREVNVSLQRSAWTSVMLTNMKKMLNPERTIPKVLIVDPANIIHKCVIDLMHEI